MTVHYTHLFPTHTSTETICKFIYIAVRSRHTQLHLLFILFNFFTLPILFLFDYSVYSLFSVSFSATPHHPPGPGLGV